MKDKSKFKKYTLNNGWELKSNLTRKEIEETLQERFYVIKEEELKEELEK